MPTDEEIAFANRLAEAAKLAGIEIRRAEDIYSPEITLARAMLRKPVMPEAFGYGQLVWIADAKGQPMPQIWFADGQSERQEKPLQSHMLKPEDVGLNTDQLAKRYPFVWKPMSGK